MKKWKVTAKVNGKEVVVTVRRHYQDGIPLEREEVMRDYILPHIRKSRAKIEIISIEEI